MSVESRPNKLVKGLVLDTFHTDVDNTVATYALNSQLEDQEGNHFHYGSEVGTTYIKEIPENHVVIGHINMERNETVLFTTDGTNSTIGILSRKDDMSYEYEIKVDDTKQEKKLNFKKEGYVRGVYRLLNGCDKVIYFVDGINKDRRLNINQLDSYKLPDTQSVASGIIFDDSLRAIIYGLSSATGNIQLIRLLSANPEATANVLATLTSGAELTKLLTASANGIGTAFANLMRTANMVSTLEASGTTTSNVDIVRLLQGNISSIGSVNAILEVRTAGLVEIDVTLTGVASSTAILLRAALLESSLTTEASTVVDAILTRVINAQSQATANTSATAQITVPINATANATATTAAEAILSYAVNATANAMAETSATAQLSQVINASLNATATSSVEALIGLVLISTTTANGSISTANLFINRLLTSSVTAQGTTTAEALISKLLQSSVTGQADTTSNAVVSKLASSSVTAQASVTANSLVSKLLASTVNGIGSVTANLQIADLLSLTVTGTATTEAVLEAISAIVGDPYIDNVSLLLQGDDNPTGVTQNNTFIDSSTNNFTITRNGNVTQGTFSPFDRAITNSGGSAYFDGTGDYLLIPTNAGFNFSNGAYTIEVWIYLTAFDSFESNIFSIGSSLNSLNFNVSPNGALSISRYGVGFLITGNAGDVSLNTWTHVAVSRVSTATNQTRLFVNGILKTTGTDANTHIDAPAPIVGGFSNLTTYDLIGYISNLRVVKGTAVYTTNFQPSTIPLTAITNTSLLLNFNNAAIFDAVKNNNIETVGNASINTSVVKYGTGSLSFDGNGDFLSIPSNINFAFGTGDFTIEFFVRFNFVNKEQVIFDFRTNNTGTSLSPVLALNTSGQFYYFFNGAIQITTSAVTANVFHHVALVRNAGNTRIYINGSQSGTTYVNSSSLIQDGVVLGLNRNNLGNAINFLNLDGYLDDFRITKGIARYTSNFTVPSKLSSLIPNNLINRSLRFSSSRSTFLNRTPTVAGNRTTWTWSGWVKMSEVSSNANNIFSANSGAAVDGGIVITSSSINVSFNGNTFNKNTSIVLRDLAAWYHIVVVLNTSSAIADQRIRVYVNGIEQTNYTVANSGLPGQGYVPLYLNNATIHNIGKLAGYNQDYFNGYLAEVNFIDGQILTPTSFGELSTTTGTWIPKLYTGTYGTNGFRLKFSDLTQLGEDFSGNLNNWTPNNFTTTPGANYDLINDTPINADETIGNYATLNPLRGVTGSGVFSNGNLQVNGVQGSINCFASGTIAFHGKTYCEVTIIAAGADSTTVGVGLVPVNSQQNTTINNMLTGIYYLINGSKRITGTNTSYGLSYTTGDIIGIAVDVIAEKVTFYKNNSSQGEILGTGIISTGVLLYIGFQDSGNPVISTNFGQRPFAYTPPTGFKALNTSNLPTPTIGATAATQANKFMDISLYTGTGAAQSVFNSGAFQPDLVWIKNRTGTASNHAIYDSVRGVTKQLSSSTTAAETTETTGLTAFNSNGFTIGALAQINTSGSNYIAWQWKASGTTVANTVGTIASTVSVNTTAGFSIVRYTGTSSNGTVGHGLGVTPKFIIIKNISITVNWGIYHSSLGNGSPQTYIMQFDNAAQYGPNATYWNSTIPTPSVFSIGTLANVNANANNYIAYCWAEIDGYSKFDSYVGNGNADGTFIYTGFRPKFILIKGTGAGTNWVMYNSIVDTSNPVNDELLANSSANENTVTLNDIDFLSNGFKLRGTDSNINTLATTYIYGAFAEFPLKYANAALTERVKEPVSVDYLIVAAGGGGGGTSTATSSGGSGGGAGGYRTTVGVSGGGGSAEPKLFLDRNQIYNITIGAPGNGGIGLAAGLKASDTTFYNITSIGGGGGSSGNGDVQQSTVGGSAGGGGTVAKLGTLNQGYAGGTGGIGSNTPGGGGGGAAGAGGNGLSSVDFTGSGGASIQSNITGTSIFYAGGGGGGDSDSTTNGGLGGTNSGGNGGTNTLAATAGTQFTGGGGGGASKTFSDKNGKNGGSGVVIIRWLTSTATITLAGGAETNAVSYTDGSFSIREIRNSGTLTFN